MGFGTNLGKSFIRSAVNQVGRDAGRVVSNNLYGGAHSTPYRNVNDNSGTFVDDSEQPEIIGYEDTTPSNFGIIIRVFFAFIFNIIGAIILILYGVNRRSNKQYVKVKKIVRIHTYEHDNRCKDGMRYSGDIIDKIPTVSQADEEQERRNETISNIYIYSGVAIIAFFIIIMITSNIKA